MNQGDFQQRLQEARHYLITSHFAEALTRYERLTRGAYGTGLLWLEYGNAAAGLREFALAEKAWRKSIELAPKNPELLVQIGHQYASLRKPEQARACFAQAALAAPTAINPRISLAVLFERQHRLADARAVVSECLALNPRDEQARYLSAVLDRRENKFAGAETQLRDLIGCDLRHPYVRYACRYELARLLDQMDRVDEAMELLSQAKQIVRGQADTTLLLKKYDETAGAALRFTLAQPKEAMARWATRFPADKRAAIPRLSLLGGHPWSGTTLLAQILDAHSEMAALDESSAFTAVLEAGFRTTARPTTTHLNMWRRRYINALLDETGPGGLSTVSAGNLGPVGSRNT